MTARNPSSAANSNPNSSPSGRSGGATPLPFGEGRGGATSYLRYLWTTTAGFHRTVALRILLGVVRVGAILAFIWLSKTAIDCATGRAVPTSLGLVGMFALMVVCMGADVLLSQWARYLESRATMRMNLRVNRRLFNTLMFAPLVHGRQGFHSGDMLNRLTLDVRSVTTFAIVQLPAMIVLAVQLVGAFVFLAWLNPYLALAPVIIMPVCLIAAKLYFRRQRRLAADIRAGESRMHVTIQEGLKHRTVLRSLRAVGTLDSRLADIQAEVDATNRHQARLSVTSGGITRLGFVAGYLVAFGWSIFSLRAGLITFGTMTAFLQLVNRIQTPIAGISSYLPSLITTTVAIDRLRDISGSTPANGPTPTLPKGEGVSPQATASVPPPLWGGSGSGHLSPVLLSSTNPPSASSAPLREVDPHPEGVGQSTILNTPSSIKKESPVLLSSTKNGAIPPPHWGGSGWGYPSPVLLSSTSPLGLSVRSVSFRYAPDEPAILTDFSHDFPPGSRTMIVGTTGAGKTTLIRLLLGLLTPNAGTVTLYDADGSHTPVSDATLDRFTYVPQGNSLLPGTIRDNLLLAAPEATPAQLDEALHIAAADFVHTLPLGLDTPCDETGGGLSEGQAQRIAIARALLRPADIILLDEFNSALDTDTAATLMQRLTTARPPATIITIAHHRTPLTPYHPTTLHLD